MNGFREAELGPVRRGDNQDWERLHEYVRRHLPGVGTPTEVQQFFHGGVNLTYLLRYERQEFVLQCQPRGVLAPGAHDMTRSYRVLSRLADRLPTAPHVYLLCSERNIIGVDWVLMEFRRGTTVRDRIPDCLADHERAGRRLGSALIRALADLHRMNPDECGLGDLGRPEGFTNRQLAGWKRRWDLVRPDDEHLPLIDDVWRRLSDSLPSPSRSSIVHNDFKLDNCQFSCDSPDTVTSIFDWDMATLGDPLIDLGTLLQYWPSEGDADIPPDRRLSLPGLAEMGLPTRCEMVDRYRSETGLDVECIGWWIAFGFWKTAIVVQQLLNRYEDGDSTDRRVLALAAKLPLMAAAADAELRRLAV